jgi:hypothetical protein
MQSRDAHNPFPVTPTEAPAPSSADSGILSFATSTSANDERRRSIVSDDEEIDKSCVKILDFTKLEQNTGEQGMKDRSHGYNGNSALFRGSSEMRDSLNMSDQVRLGLEERTQGKAYLQTQSSGLGWNLVRQRKKRRSARSRQGNSTPTLFV